MADDPKTDPRTREPEGNQGMPQEFIDDAGNLPGDQPEDDPQRPSLAAVEGRDADDRERDDRGMPGRADG